MYNKRVVFWSACMGMLLFGIALITLGSIAPGLKVKLDLDEIKAGILFSILPLGILSGSLLFGPLVDRFGYRILLFVSCLLLSAGFEGVAFTSSHWFIKICVFLIGLSGGAINGATNAMVSDISVNGKTANISLLGVFFGIGALGMPLVLGILSRTLSFEKILAVVGILSFIAGIIYAFIKLPPSKITQNLPFKGIIALFKDKMLILIAAFLFFQSSYEGIINNWTTTYLNVHLGIEQDVALYGLSLYVAGMVIMRLITGTILRNLPVKNLLVASFVFLLLGLLFIWSGFDDAVAMAGFMLLGAGLAGGFPVMLGITGERYADISGTAFSFVLVFALLGNMILNYGMGIISQEFGISHLVTVVFVETLIMMMLCILILKRRKYVSKTMA